MLNPCPSRNSINNKFFICLTFSIFIFAQTANSEENTRIQRPIIIARCAIVNGTGGINSCPTVIKKYYSFLRHEGALSPESRKDSPTSACSSQSGGLALDIGSNTYFATSFPATVLRMGGQSIIKLDKLGNKIVLSDLRLFDDRDNVVASINDDHFWIQEDLRFEKMGKNTLLVYDHFGNEALRLIYKAPNLISVTGTFRYPGQNPVQIDPDKMIFPGNVIFSKNCVIGGVAMVNINSPVAK